MSITLRIGRSTLNKLEKLLRLSTNRVPQCTLNSVWYNKRKLHDGLPSQSSLKNVYLVDETSNDSKPTNTCNKFTYRTHNCGELRSSHVGSYVTLCGWLEFQRYNNIFVIRDAYGHTQIIVESDNVDIQKLLSNSPLESVIKITGTVLSRPQNMINKKQTTGEIEVLVSSCEVLNQAKATLPFNIREFQKPKEALGMQYRYMDLRFSEMQRNLRVRSQFTMSMREFFKKYEFVDVETPTLFKATPGGAQEFIVPTRFPGLFYSLVQSPQQFKQMLMAGCTDRYFQIARCYRDEGSRSDRQPEFTQLDLEVSFTSKNDIMKLVEELLEYSWPDSLSPLPRVFNKLTYKEAMQTFGSDKPDTRYEFYLQDCTSILKENTNLITDNFGAHCLVFRQPYVTLSKSIKEDLTKLAKRYPKIKFVLNKISNVKDWSSKIEKLLGKTVVENLIAKMRLENDCILALAYGDVDEVLPLLGSIRVEYVNSLEKQGHIMKKEGFHPIWITDFPLFEKGVEPNSFNTTHHPFTAPHEDDFHLLQDFPLKVRSQAYDLVLNGNEVGGGSIRIHNSQLQETIFDMLNLDKTTMQYMLEMLDSGCPPHGGIALGLDRLLATMLETTSIRDVIAFPKSFEGRDLISGAPSLISEHDKKLYHLEIVDKNDNKC